MAALSQGWKFPILNSVSGSDQGAFGFGAMGVTLPAPPGAATYGSHLAEGHSPGRVSQALTCFGCRGFTNVVVDWGAWGLGPGCGCRLIRSQSPGSPGTLAGSYCSLARLL